MSAVAGCGGECGGWQVAVAGGEGGVFSIRPTHAKIRVAPRSYVRLPVVYRPGELGAQSGTLIIHSGGREVRLALRGDAVESYLAVSSSQVAPGGAIRCFNMGDTPLAWEATGHGGANVSTTSGVVDGGGVVDIDVELTRTSRRRRGPHPHVVIASIDEGVSRTVAVVGRSTGRLGSVDGSRSVTFAPDPWASPAPDRKSSRVSQRLR